MVKSISTGLVASRPIPSSVAVEHDVRERRRSGCRPGDVAFVISNGMTRSIIEIARIARESPSNEAVAQ